MTRPPSASTRSCGARRSVPRLHSATISKASVALVRPGADRDRRAARHGLEHVERAEVDGAGDLRRRRCVPVDGELRRHAGAARRRPQLRDQPARLEERREDPSGEFLDLRQRPPRFTLELVQERPRLGGIALQRARRDLQVRRRDRPGPVARPRGERARCRAARRRPPTRVVPATLGAPRSRGATGRAWALRRSARFPGDVLPCLDPASSPSSFGRASSGPARYRAGWQHPGVRQAATVEPAGKTS